MKRYIECPNCGDEISIELVEHNKQVRAEVIKKYEDELKVMREKLIESTSTNRDYLTGYISAVSALEGFSEMLKERIE